jgi:ubiquinone biosynthesis protein COQ9
MEQEEIRDRIVLSTLVHVAFEGWSDRAVRAGIADSGLSKEEAGVAFPGGIEDMIEHWSNYSDRRMLEVLERVDLSSMRLRERIATAVRVRIEVNAPYREAVRRTLSYLALPTHTSLAARSTYSTLNGIWYACGDTSTDVTFYTKRALLAGVYGATVLYWLDDASEEFVDTWAFLDRRLGDVMRVPRLMSRLRETVSSWGRPFALRSRGASGE